MDKAFLKYGVLCVAGVGLAYADAALAAEEKKPNVLFIPVDDLKPLLGCYGDKQIHTPNIDRLAARGIVFINAYCQQALCGPTRASVMTGLYPDSTRVWDLKTRMRDMNPDVLTLPQYFKRSGYVTTGVGKTYDPRCVGPKLDAPSWSIPYRKITQRDFPHDVLFPVDGHYQSPEIRKRHALAMTKIKAGKLKGKEALAVKREYNSKPVTECLDIPDDAYMDGAIAKIGCGLLEKLSKGEKPFFISVGFKKPHLPFAVPKKYWDMYDRNKIDLAPFRQKAKNDKAFTYQDSWELRSCYTDVPVKGAIPENLQRKMIHGYMASVSFMDAQLGKVLDKLDELGLTDNTIICLWGDHGWHLGDHGMWCKHTNFEEATRAPLIFAGPGAPKGAVSKSIVEFVDIFPTICSLAGLDVPKQLQGKSLIPIFKYHEPSFGKLISSIFGAAREPSVRRAAMSQFCRYYDKGKFTMGYAVRDGRYRYVEWILKDFRKGEKAGPVVFRQLFDYKRDPLETVNQAANPEYEDVVKKMSGVLHEDFGIQSKP